MASFIICQLAEQFWSVNLVTAAFGVRIPNISNWDITKVHLLGNHTYSGINISAWRQNDSWRSSEKIQDVLLFARVSHVETFVTSWALLRSLANARKCQLEDFFEKERYESFSVQRTFTADAFRKVRKGEKLACSDATTRFPWASCFEKPTHSVPETCGCMYDVLALRN